MTSYFTFEIDGERVGYYEESESDGEVVSNARMVIEGEAYENPFGIRHRDGRVTAYRFGDSDWIDFDEAEDVFPTSALPLLVSRALATGELRYVQFLEGEGRVGEEARLEAGEDGVIQESVAGRLGRRVVVGDDGIVIEYGWGGTAISRRCASREDAVKGTRWES